MIDFTPNPIAFALGSFEIRWYGIGYVAAIVAGTWLATREARRRGERTDVIVDGVVVLAIAALIGGRAYHVIDQWAYYQDHLAQIFLPPYSGLGIYGGLFTGMLARSGMPAAATYRSGAGPTSSFLPSCWRRPSGAGATS